jgi:cation transport ATPase
MYTGLLHLHSFLRYAVLFFLLLAVIKSFSGWLGKKPYTAADNKLSLITIIVVHVQLLVGLGLYFISPLVQTGNMAEAMKDKVFRFFTVEHSAMMLAAVVLITVGRSLSKRAANDLAKHKKTAFFFLIGLIIILLAIPWPFSSVARGWF